MSLVAALLRLMTFAGVVYKQDTVKQTCWCSENLVLFSQPLIFFHINMYDCDIKKLGQSEGNNLLHWGIFFLEICHLTHPKVSLGKWLNSSCPTW